MRADLVHEVAVVRHDYHRVVEIIEEVLQPCDRFQVQVVRRLVEEKDVRVAEERLRQEHAHLLPALELPHRACMQVVGDAQAAEERRGIGLRLITVHRVEHLLQLRGAVAVLIGEIVLLIDRVPFTKHFVELSMPHNDGLQHRELVEGELVLAQRGDSLARIARHLALVWFQLARKYFQERGLPRSVGPDEPVAVPRGKLYARVLEKHPLPERQRHIRHAYHPRFTFS